jgi:anti-sigma regulatory factor (Ser/Thr protein kinase)
MMEFERAFSADAANVPRARSFVADVLASTPVDVQVARLLTSELVTNAVLHTQSGFRVRVRSGPDIVRVEVVNDEPELLLAMREPSEDGGRGLRLVQELSVEWGVESTRDEKIVWFEVPTSRRDHEPARK